MKTNLMKKVCSFLLCMLMVVGVLPLNLFAQQNNGVGMTLTDVRLDEGQIVVSAPVEIVNSENVAYVRASVYFKTAEVALSGEAESVFADSVFSESSSILQMDPYDISEHLEKGENYEEYSAYAVLLCGEDGDVELFEAIKSDGLAFSLPLIVTKEYSPEDTINFFVVVEYAMDSNGTHLLCNSEPNIGTIKTSPCPHEDIEVVTVSEATCTENGLVRYTCSFCEETINEVVSESFGGHKIVKREVSSATCTTEGVEEEYCSVCYEVVSTIKTEKTSHVYSSADSIKQVSASCTEDGYIAKTCDVCGDVSIQELESIGHKREKDAVVIPATCTSQGSSTVYCMYCNEVIRTTVLPQLEHSYTLELDVDCNICGYVRKVYTSDLGDGDRDGVITAKDINLLLQIIVGAIVVDNEESLEIFDLDGDRIITAKDINMMKRYLAGAINCFHSSVIYPGEAATCETDGWTDGEICVHCGKILKEREKIYAPGHAKTVIELVNPTCTENGYKKAECAVCSLVYIEEVIESTGHAFGEGEIAKEANCTDNGITLYCCAVCGETSEKVFEKLGHDFSIKESSEDGADTFECSRCGLQENGDSLSDVVENEMVLTDCDTDFTFEIVTENDEGYIYENLTIVDLKAQDTENADETKIPYLIAHKENNIWVISPDGSYEEGGNYLCSLDGDICFADSDANSMMFCIARASSGEVDVKDSVIFVSFPEGWESDFGTYSIDDVSDENYIYVTLPAVAVGKNISVNSIICVGDYENEEQYINTPGKTAHFGKVKEINNISSDTIILTLETPDLWEIFDKLDVYETKYADFSSKEVLENLEAQAEALFLESEEVDEQFANGYMAAQAYAQDRGLSIPDFNNEINLGDRFKLSITTKAMEGGVYIEVKGDIILLAKKEGHVVGSFNIYVTLGIKVIAKSTADIDISWLKVKEFRSVTTLENTFTLDVGVKFDLTIAAEKQLGTHGIIKTTNGKYHMDNCAQLSKESRKNAEAVTEYQIEREFVSRKGVVQYWECTACKPISVYMADTYYVQNTHSKIIHRFTCGSSDRCSSSDNVLTSTYEYDGYSYCKVCRPESSIGADYYNRITKDLNNGDWKDAYNAVSGLTNNKDGANTIKKELPAAVIPLYCGVVLEVWFDINLILEIKFEGSIGLQYSYTSKNTWGMYIDDRGDLKKIESQESNSHDFGFEIMGKVELRIGFQLEVKVTFHGLSKFLYLSISGELGVYCELRGLYKHNFLDSNERFGIVYAEVGLFVDAKLNYKVVFWKGSLSLIKGPKKFPFLKVGYDRLYYNYENATERLNLSSRTVDLNRYYLINAKYYDAKDPESSGSEQLNFNGENGKYTVEVRLLDENGNVSPYASYSNGYVYLTADAPCDTVVRAEISVIGENDPCKTFLEYLNVNFVNGNYSYDLPTLCIDLAFEVHRYSNWETVIPATCTEEGLQKKYYACECRDANGERLEYKSQVMPALGHSRKTIPAIKMTCTTDGRTSGVGCARCDYIFVAPKIIPARGHMYADPYTCHDRPCQYSDCDHVEEATTPHVFSTWVSVPTGSCAEVDFEMRSCQDCFFVETTLPEDGVTHGCSFVFTVQIDPTCTETGSYKWECKNGCGTTGEENKKALGHSMNGTGFNESQHYKYCTNPNCTYKENYKDHYYTNVCDRVCNGCDFERDVNHNFEFSGNYSASEYHWQICSKCNTITEKEAHSGGAATCVNKAVCSVCDTAYGKLSSVHVYDNSCDAICNLCEKTREITHTWDNGCDTICNVCGYERVPTHRYSNVCDDICNDCEEVRTAPHNFKNSCDNECDRCGLLRDAGHKWKDEYSYNSIYHWIACSVCNETKDTAAHSGGNATCKDYAICDTCNNEYGSLLECTFDDNCDGKCNVCETEREAPHYPSNDYVSNEDCHWKECTECFERIGVAIEHSGGKADCITLAACKYCDTPYGEYGDHTGGTATCIEKAICKVCSVSYGDYADHVNETEFDLEMHWKSCTVCGVTKEAEYHQNGETYDSYDQYGHWKACEDCSVRIDETAHVFDNKCDANCNICKYTRSVRHTETDVYVCDEISHVKRCPDCNGFYDRENHTGGTATCFEQKVCTVCSGRYGKLAEHTWADDMSYDLTHHWIECTADGCDEKKDYGEHEHDKYEKHEHSHQSVCVCGAAIGEKEIHYSVDTSGLDCTHGVSCDICSYLYISPLEHEYTDLCDDDCNRDGCDFIRKAPHNPSTVYQHNDINHWKICMDCKEVVNNGVHSGTSATCVKRAYCTVCGSYYGEYAEHRYSNSCDTTCNTPGCKNTREIQHDFSGSWKTDNYYHWKECKVCGKESEHEGHVEKTAATCTSKAVCSVCQKSYGEVSKCQSFDDACDSSCNLCGKTRTPPHSYGDTYEFDGNYHWKECTLCHKKKDKASHSGGTATCIEIAECQHCAASYGDLADHEWDKENPSFDGSYHYYTCTVCGETQKKVHVWSTKYVSDETYHWKVCSGCEMKKDSGEHYGGEASVTCLADGKCLVCDHAYYITTGHSHTLKDDKYVYKAATCTEVAVYYYNCSKCKANRGSETYEGEEPLNHDFANSFTYIDSDGHARTCNRKGCDEHLDYGSHFGGTITCEKQAICSVCNNGYGEYGPKHDYSREAVLDEYLYKKATCTEKALYYYACQNCDAKGKNTFEYGFTAAHDWNLDTYMSDQETHYHKCKNCDAQTDIVEHIYGQYETETYPTCTEKGEKARYCTVCDYRDAAEIPSLGHNLSDEFTVRTTGPQINKKGEEVYVHTVVRECIREGCDYEESYGSTYEHAHKKTKVIPGYPANCTTPGKSASLVCDVEGCGHVYVESEEIPSLGGHIAGEAYYFKEPTCTEDGIKVTPCTRCSDDVSRDVVDALSHDLVDGTCSRCGYEEYDAAGTTGECFWKLKGTVLTIYGNGKMGNYSFGTMPWGTGITEVVINKGVTSIGDYAFSYCSSLTSIEIPDSVTSIGDWAFFYCSSLTSIEIPDSVTRIGDWAFDYCTSLTSIEIPEGVTSIGYAAFAGCTSLTSIELPEGVTSIGDYAFEGCTNLTSIELPEGVTSIGGGIVGGCVNLKSLTVDINNTVYYSEGNCIISKEDKVLVAGCDVSVIPDSVTSIGSYAFYYCESLTSIEIPDSVTSIGNYAFYDCSSLTSIEIPDSVTSIGYGAFSGCESLTSIEIPEGVTSIGSYAFYKCTSLTTVYYGGTEEMWNAISIGSYNEYLTNAEIIFLGEPAVPEGLEYEIIDGEVTITDYTGSATELVIPATIEGSPVTSIGYWAFYDCSSLTSIELPDGVTSIGSYAFYYCRSLTSIELPDSVTSIGDHAFLYCSSLTSIEIPVGVTSISEGAFYYCRSLTSIELPDNVTSIGSYAFYNCYSLTSIELPDSVTSIGDYAFEGCTNLTSIEIPDSVTSIGDGIVGGCVDLKSLTVDINNTVYYSEGNCIISKEDKVLVAGCDVSVIPDSVTSIGNYAFYCCYNLTSIELPEGVTSIGYAAFSYCTSLTSIEIPDSVTSIGYYAFGCCTSLTSIEIPEGVTSIGDGIVGGCVNLKSLTVDINNTVYYSEGNCIISKEDKVLVAGCDVSVIPDSVTSIGAWAFYDCYILTSIEIPDSVTSIGSYAFYNCISLTTVYYGGTEEMWNAISIGSYNEYLTNAEIIFLGELVCSHVPGAAATCTTAQVCTLCGEVLVEALYHLVGREEIVQPTCTNDGYRIIWCDRCGKEIRSEVIVAQGHTLGPDATCTTDQTCAACNFIIQPALGHNYTDGVCNRCGYKEYDAAGTTGECFWKLKGTVLTIYGNGKMKNYSRKCGPWGTGITQVIIQNGVTSIGNDAFYNCTNLASIVIPVGVSSVGTYAFYGCTNLTSIVIPEGVTKIGSYAFYGCTNLASVVVFEGITSIDYKTFSGCTNLESIVIPESVTSIGDDAFYDCTSLTSIVIPEGATRIGSYAFRGCTSLTSVTNLQNITSIGDSAFSGCTSLANIVIPESVTSIGKYAFCNCTRLESVVISAGAMNIGDSAFYGCANLSEVHILSIEAWCSISFVNYAANPLYTGAALFLNGEMIINLVIPEGVTSIGDYAFSGCTSFASVVVPRGVTSIGDSVFNNCINLASIVISEGVTSIGDYAFSGCTSLASIVIPEGVTSIGNFMFWGCTSLASIVISKSVTGICEAAFYGCTSLTSIVIPESVTSISNHAFYNCTSLTSVVVPGGVTSISNAMFDGCINLASIVISEGVTSIGDRAFYNCTSLTSIELPDSVTSIGDYAFYDCKSLTSIELPDSVTSIGNYAFSRCISLTSIQIPEGVTSIGNYAFSRCISLTSIQIPEGVTSIGGGIVGGCENLTSLTVDINNTVYYSEGNCIISKEDKVLVAGCDVSVIPDSVTSIGNYAFYYCRSLTSIELPDSVTSIGSFAFSECYNLTSIEIPEGVTSIGGYAFDYCTSLTSIELPEGVTSIGIRAFDGCRRLTTVYYGGTEEMWNAISIASGNSCLTNAEIIFLGDLGCSHVPGSAATCTEPQICTRCGEVLEEALDHNYAGGVCTRCGEKDKRTGTTGDCTWTLDGTVLTISGDGEMGDYSSGTTPWGTGITEVVINEGVTSIGDWAFDYCFSLTSIEIPDSVTSIGDYAFSYCESLTSIELPEGVTSIGNYAFYDCSSLTSIEIPEGVTSIGDYAFRYCSSLRSIEIPDGVTSIGDYAFYYCRSLTSIEIPAGVTSIGDYAFYYCRSLTSVEIPDSVTSIGYHAFGCCTSLTSIEIPDSVTSIGDCAFYNCSSLRSIEIPEGVTSIGKSAFYYCESLTSIELPEGVTSIGDYAFYNCYSLTTVYFGGTEEMWNAISIASGNESLTNAEIIFLGELVCSHVPGPAATCTTAQVCTLCGEVLMEALGHMEGECIRIEATCTVDGSEVVYCGNCGIIIKSEVLIAQGHIPGAVMAQGADCLEPGYRAVICGICDFEISREIIPMLDHTYVDGVCTYCGNKEFKTFGTTGDCFWRLDGTVLTIYGNGAMGDYDFDSKLPWGNAITKVIIEEGVENIGQYAFKNCFDLTEVSIAEGVWEISDYAFFWCEALETVDCPLSLEVVRREAFSGCSSLVSIALPWLLCVIDDYAFDGCTSLTTVWYQGEESDREHWFDFSNGNQCLANATWYYCVCIKNPDPEKKHVSSPDEPDWCQLCDSYFDYVATAGTTGDCEWKIVDTTLIISGNGEMHDYDYTYGNDVPWYKSIDVITCVIVEEGVTHIGSRSFQMMSLLESVELPESLVSIGSEAFDRCCNLVSISIPDNVAYIGEFAFNECTGLTYISFGKGLKTLSNYSFYGCTGVSEIYYNAVCADSMIDFELHFYRLGAEGDGIKVTIGKDVGYVAEGLFYNVWWEDRPYVTSVVFEEGSKCTDIGHGAFADLNIRSIVLPESILYIGNYAFGGCYELASVTMGNKVLGIGADAFAGTAISEIIVPQSVIFIGAWAFSYCDSLKKAYINCNDCVMEDDIFGWSESVTIYASKNSSAYGYALEYEIPFVSV